MKSSILVIFLMPLIVFSQQTDGTGAHKNFSYDSKKMTNEVVNIPLHDVVLNDLEIPIFLSYNSAGLRPSELPSSVGFGWKLNAGGEIKKEINHLVDETNDGWFFGATPTFEGFTGYSSFQYRDISPDKFSLNISNGTRANFFMKKNVNGQDIDLTPIIYNNSNNIQQVLFNPEYIYQSSYDASWSYDFPNEDASDISLSTKEGHYYEFRRGLKRTRPWDLNHENETKTDSSEYKNYYLHKVRSLKNNNEISFNYVHDKIQKVIPHANGKRTYDNDTPQTPPDPDNDPINTTETYEDISIEDNSRKLIKEIIADNQKIVFRYKKRIYTSGGLYSSTPNQSLSGVAETNHQSIKILDEIEIYDHNENYIYGYKFEYTVSPQSQNQADLTDYEGHLKLKKILKYGKNRKSYKVYKEFKYHPFNTDLTRPAAGEFNRDVFGFYNGVEEGLTDVQSLLPDRHPDLLEMRGGMLRSITNENGGKLEYEYSLNRHQDMYYGGLLISAANSYNENDELVRRKEFEYDNPEGFGLPIYSQDTCFDSNQIIEEYPEGYLECTQSNYLIWKSYFTQQNPTDQYIEEYKYFYDYHGLFKNAPTLDILVSNNQYQGFNQIEFGSFYSEVTEKLINVENSSQEKGYVVKHYIPSLEGFNLSKNLSRIEYYNNVNELVKEESYDYEYYLADTFYLKSVNYYSSPPNYIEKDPFYQIEEYVRSTTVKNYNIEGSLQNTKTKTFSYYNENANAITPDFSKIETIITKYNDQDLRKQDIVYFKDVDISNINNGVDYQYLHYLNPIIEHRSWVKSNSEWILEKSDVRFYDIWGRLIEEGVINGKNENIIYDESNYTGSYVDASTGNFVIPTENKVSYNYNNNGKLISKINHKTNETYLYDRSNDHDGLYVDVVLKTKNNFNDNTFYKTSFENFDDPSKVLKQTNAFSGEYVYTDNSLTLDQFPSGHVISYWAYDSSVEQWNYIKQEHSGGVVTINIPSSYVAIDELRIQPPNTLMKTFTKKPLIGNTSELNDVGTGKRLEYDVFNNPLFFKDKNGNIIKETQQKNISTNY